MTDLIRKATGILRQSAFTTAFTGAGISVESGIPPFRGKNGLWNKYNPEILDIAFFHEHPSESWEVIREIFYDHFKNARPNKAHDILARMEREGLLSQVITQNIDDLHRLAGSKVVTAFHGNSATLRCIHCDRTYHISLISLDHLPPTCRECGGLLKPDFVFFGEAIPQMALHSSYEAASLSEVMLVIGTTGEVMPANQIPVIARQNGATIIEINPQPSAFTSVLTDIFLQGKAAEIMEMIDRELFPDVISPAPG